MCVLFLKRKPDYAIPSEDGIEICLPGIALELGHFSMDLLPSMLYEQTALSSEVSDFQYHGVVELCDDSGDKQSWYYFEFAASDTKAATVLLRLMRKAMQCRRWSLGNGVP